MYLSLCRQALSVFACVKSDPDDGQAPYGYLQADVTIKCYQGGHNLLWPLALVSIGVYVIGYPLAIARVLTQNAIPIQSDIILLAMNAGDDRASNPGAYAIRKMFKRLYYQMRYEKFYWVLLVLARKASIAGVALFLRTNAALQMSLLLVVMFIAFTVHAIGQPYVGLGRANKSAMLADYTDGLDAQSS